MTLIEKYKIRLEQLNNGHEEIYDGEKEIIEQIIKQETLQEVTNENNLQTEILIMGKKL